MDEEDEEEGFGGLSVHILTSLLKEASRKWTEFVLCRAVQHLDLFRFAIASDFHEQTITSEKRAFLSYTDVKREHFIKMLLVPEERHFRKKTAN